MTNEQPSIEQLVGAIEAADPERVRQLCEIAIEKGIARLKVGEIEIVPHPSAFVHEPRKAMTEEERKKAMEEAQLHRERITYLSTKARG